MVASKTFKDRLAFWKKKEINRNSEQNGNIPENEASKTDSSTSGEPARGQWGSRVEFFLSCVGLSVGMGNVWRFPYLAYENGGGAFLIPYIIILFLVGKPLYFMELALGQYASLGPWTAFKRMSPILSGVGVGMCVVSLIVCIYYNVIMSYTVFYMAAVFKSIILAQPLPWDVCDPEWADKNCYVRLADPNGTLANSSITPVVTFGLDNITKTRLQPSPEQYFNRYVLQKETNTATYSLENPGPIIWQLLLCLIFCWIAVFLCLMKGIQSSGKVVYFTSTFPYVILLILMIRGVLLDGAVDGIVFLFKPQWGRLLDISVWRNAASQVFFSLSVSWGGLIMFGSYNPYRLKVYKDALIVCSLDTITSIIASVVIFSVLGNLSLLLDVPVSTVAQGGQGLAFVAYPEALSKLPVPQLWSVLFFFMLFILGLDSQFGMLETVLCAIYDEFPKLRTKKPLVTAVCCLFCFMLALPCVTHGGLYVIDLMDTYGGGFAIIFIAFFEIVAVFWIYGMKRLMDNIHDMMQYRPSLYFRACWIVVAPAVLLFIFVYSMVDYKPFATTGTYPKWGDGIGWILALVSMLQIPIWAIYMVLRQRGSSMKKKFLRSLCPSDDWGPADPANRPKPVAENSLQETKLHGLSEFEVAYPPSEWKTLQVTDLDSESYRGRPQLPSRRHIQSQTSQDFGVI